MLHFAGVVGGHCSIEVYSKSIEPSGSVKLSEEYLVVICYPWQLPSGDAAHEYRVFQGISS